jgi:hypothetical protein
VLELPTFVPPTTAGLLPCVGHSALYDSPDTADQARALCAACPIQSACTAWATTHDEWGTWAGLTEEQRGTVHQELPDTPLLSVAPTETCGTEAARLRHISRQQFCPACWTARAVFVRDGRIARLAEQHATPAGGSRLGYRIHGLLDEPPCERCREQHNHDVNIHKRAARAKLRARRLASTAPVAA